MRVALWLLTNPHLLSDKTPAQTENKTVPGKLSAWMFVAIALSCGLGTWGILSWLENRDPHG